ncbi:MAG: energy-coupling factor ABC transporter ATP-binding protein, partial [Thermoflexales bacterium]|nr:energy-coupling factor ABC transporter ATP-binding protein [Thermoflexales bacterium]
MIVFERFSFTYPDATAPALREVSLTLPAGSFTLVAGPSGGGKSTLLRALNGLVPHFSGGHASGRVRVDGLDPVSVGPVGMAARVGFVFQDPEAQFVTGQVEDEIAFALENAGLPRPEMAARIEAVLSALGLTALRGREIATLSGGQMQRVAIASALVLRPGILVLDEPTSQLDPAAAEETLEAVLALRERFALTVVLAEHRLERVLPFATHLLLVEGGRARLGAPAAIRGDAPDIAPPLARLARGLGW